nr:MAG TPA: hypothetical protein [Caudoviricetes sp.]
MYDFFCFHIFLFLILYTNIIFLFLNILSIYKKINGQIHCLVYESGHVI